MLNLTNKKRKKELFDDNYLSDCENIDIDGMSNWESYGFVKKDILNGDTFKINSIVKSDNKTFSLLCDGGNIFECMIKKEKRFFELNGIDFKDCDDLVIWLKTEDANGWFGSNDLNLMVSVDGYRNIPSLLGAHYENKREELLRQVKNSDKIYNAKIIGKNNGGFIVDILGVPAFLPGSLAAANKIIDFDDYSLNKEIPVMVEDYINEGDTFIVSNKKYISHIIDDKKGELVAGDCIEGKVTGTALFGIFIEFADILTGLLHVTEMCPETYGKFKRGFFKAGSDITVYIKEIDKKNKIIFTDKQNDKLPTIEEFKENFENSILAGEVISINKNFGAFVKFTYNDGYFVGLLHNREYNKYDSNIFNVGDMVEFYIYRVDCEFNKIYLKIPK